MIGFDNEAELLEFGLVLGHEMPYDKANEYF